MDWWTRRVKVRKPIDWANSWSLEEQAKGLSFEMDSNLNLKAMPVVIVDTSMGSLVPAGPTPAPTWWNTVGVTAAASPVLVHNVAGTPDCMVQGMLLDYAASHITAGAAECFFTLRDNSGGVGVPHITHVFWSPAVETPRPSLFIPFDPPQLFTHGVNAVLLIEVDSPLYLTCWGYDL